MFFNLKKKYHMKFIPRFPRINFIIYDYKNLNSIQQSQQVCFRFQKIHVNLTVKHELRSSGNIG